MARFLRISPKDTWIWWSTTANPTGFKIQSDGRIFVADHKNGLMLLDAKRGIAPLIARRNLEGFKGLNDLHFAGNGDLFHRPGPDPDCGPDRARLSSHGRG